MLHDNIVHVQYGRNQDPNVANNRNTPMLVTVAHEGTENYMQLLSWESTNVHILDSFIYCMKMIYDTGLAYRLIAIIKVLFMATTMELY